MFYFQTIEGTQIFVKKGLNQPRKGMEGQESKPVNQDVQSPAGI